MALIDPINKATFALGRKNIRATSYFFYEDTLDVWKNIANLRPIINLLTQKRKEFL